MTELNEMEEKLRSSFPKIWTRRTHLPQNEKTNFDFWGVEAPKGWYDLLYHLSTMIQWRLDQNPKLAKQFRIRQVKEKFGSLCFYYTCDDPYIDGLVQMAERLSGFICVKCGEKARIRMNDRYYVTLCDQHQQEWEAANGRTASIPPKPKRKTRQKKNQEDLPEDQSQEKA